MTIIAITEAARRLGVHPNTIHLWEKKGLVKPIRDTSNRRLFTEDQIEELAKTRLARQGRPEAR